MRIKNNMFNPQNKESVIILGIAIALLVFSFGRMVVLHKDIFPPSAKNRAAELPPINPFLSLNLKARAVFVWDIKRKEPLYALNEHAQLPLASLTKIMTALVALEEKGESSVIAITKEAILEEGDHGFITGEKWRLKDLINATLLTSSNDGAHALASVFTSVKNNASAPLQRAFIQKMNQKVKEIGLFQTFFTDEAGLDFNEYMSGAYGSAGDVARLLEFVLTNHPALMEATSRALLTTRSIDGNTHNFENTNKFVETLPGVIASKTGFTDLAGGNLAIAFDAGPARPIVIVVLGSTAEERFTDAEQLIWASLKKVDTF